ncbi:MAG: flippase-like domain-containing protein, partial [Planctomycetes bacterium]|nr:flippase-like domain-containing protein [Planctomycetota bacterium]
MDDRGAKLGQWRRWSPFLRVALTILACGLIVRLVDFDALGKVLAGARWWWILTALAIYFVSHVSYAVSVGLLLAAMGYRVRLGTILCNHYMGLFFNNFLPSSVGGDAYKIYDMSFHAVDMPAAATAIVLQRVLAMLSTTALVMVFVPLLCPVRVSITSGIWAAALVLLVALMVMVVLRIPARLKRYRGANGLLSRMVAWWDVITGGFFRLRRSQTILRVVAMIVVYQFLMVTGPYTLARGLDVPAAWTHFLYIVPVSILAMALPISVNGIGVREGVYLLLLEQVGVARTDALALVTLVFGVALANSLIG